VSDFGPYGGPLLSSRRGQAYLMHGRRCLVRDALDFRCRLEPGTSGLPSHPWQQIDFIMKPTLFVKALQVRQQSGTRGLHRFWCWPRRSSHGQDQLGYRPCTLAPRPAPKSTTTLSDIDLRCPPLILSPEIARRSSRKKLSDSAGLPAPRGRRPAADRSNRIEAPRHSEPTITNHESLTTWGAR
jgi:hypothetical protein